MNRNSNRIARWRQRFRAYSDRLPALRLAAIYGVFSAVYILASDSLVSIVARNPQTLSILQTYKGLGFIATTTILLYVTVLAQTRAIQTRKLEANEQARLHNDIADLGRNVLQARSLAEIYQLVLHQVALSLSIDMTKLAVLEGTTEFATAVEGYGWRGEGIEAIQVPTSSEFLTGKVLEARRPIIVERLVEAEKFKIPEFLLEQGAVSSMVAPIINEVPLGVLGAHHKQFRRFTRSEANFLQSAANLLGQAILNFKSQDEARIRSELLDSVGQAVIATDPEGTIFYWNQAAETMYGWSRQEAVGSSVVELTPALGQDARAAEIMQQMRLGQPWEGEFRLRRKDGTEFAALVRNSLLHDAAGNVSGVVGITTDISKIKSTQRALQLASDRLALQHRIDQQILAGETLDQMAQDVLTTLSEQIPYDHGVIVRYEREGDRFQRLARVNMSELHASDEWQPMSQLGLAGQLELPAEPINYIRDLQATGPAPPILQDLIDDGQRSFLIARMIYRDEVLGAIGLSRRPVDAFTTDDIDLLKLVADSLAVGLHDMQLRNIELKRALELESLQRMSVGLVSELDYQLALNGTAEAGNKLLSADNTYLYLFKDESDELEFAAGWSHEGPMDESLFQPRPEGITIKSARSGQRASFQQVAENELFHGDFPDWEGSLISQPISYRGKVLGVLNLSFLEQQSFSKTDFLIVDLLADMAAAAIHNAHQYETLSQKRRESEALFMVTQRLAGEYQLREVLDVIVYSVHEVIDGAEAASLWLGDGNDESMAAEAWYGLPDEVMESVNFSKTNSCVGYVLESQLPLKVDDTSQSDQFRMIGNEKLDSVRSLIGVPIWIGQEVIGALFADNYQQTEAFNQDDFRMLEVLANQAASAIQRARLFDQILDGRNRLEQMSKDLVRVQEEERGRLARELHDEIGQLLTGLKLTLEIGQDQLKIGKNPDLAPAVDIAEQLLTQVRDLSLRLRPSMLDDLGLLPTLMWQVRRAEEQLNLEVEFKHEGIENRRFSDVIETTAFRVAQEALTNTARHAGTNQVRLIVRAETTDLELLVEDRGLGFEPKAVSQLDSAQGLAGMRERAILAGGNLQVESAPGEGAKIRLSLPLEGAVERRSGERES